jgi:cysteine desulfurase / selenocysteine lyase
VASLDLDSIRRAFPVLKRTWNGAPIVYADNAATTLKPQPVIDAVQRYLSHSTGNIHRANHLLSQEASIAFEEARGTVARWLNCVSESVVFVRGATEAINVVAAGLGLAKTDNVVGTILEHHSNILPWSSRCEYRAAPLDDGGLPEIEAAERLIDRNTRLITITQCSNVTGVCPDIAAWVRLARRHGLPILVDGAQSGLHVSTDVTALDVDFYVVSGHKVCGPPGVGVLYGKSERLLALRVTNLGGGAVSRVNDDFTYELRELPWRFESGTPDVAAVWGFGAALSYLESVGMAALTQQNQALATYLYENINIIDGIRVLCPRLGGSIRAPTLSFWEASGTFSPDFVSRLLNDSFAIMTRHGHHCAHPLHLKLRPAGTVRVSLGFYNTLEEIDRVAEALRRTVSLARKTTSKTASG